MKTVPASDLRENISEYLRRVERGQEIIIERHGKAIAKLSPLEPKRAAKAQSPVMERIRSLLERPQPKRSTTSLYGSAKSKKSALEELEASRKSWDQ